MIGRQKFILLISLAVVMQIGCPENGDFWPSLPLESYCVRYVDSACTAAVRCGCVEEAEKNLCVIYLKTECDREIESTSQSGRYKYDGSEASHCLWAIHRVISDCSLVGDDWPEACGRMFYGIVPEGGACDSDSECARGMACYADLCTVMPSVGEGCFAGDDCREDLFCDADGACRPPVGVGGFCPEGDIACEEDLYCSPTYGDCQRYPGNGESCDDSGGSCRDEYYCDRTRVCRPTKTEGQACEGDEECRSDECEELVCLKEEESICSAI